MQSDVLAVLAADLENGVHRRIECDCCPRLRGDLVAHDVRADVFAGQIASRTGHTHATDLHPVAHLQADLVQRLAHGVQGPTGRAQVAAGNDLVLLVNQHHVGTDRAYVDAHVDRLWPAAIRRGWLPVGVVNASTQRRQGTGLWRRVAQCRQQGVQIKRHGGSSAGRPTRPIPVQGGVVDQGQRGAQGGHQLVMAGNDQLSRAQPQHVLEYAHDSLVAGHAALDQDGGREPFSTPDDALEIARQGVTEPGQDVGQRHAPLLQMNHVGLGKDSTARGEACRLFGLQGQCRKLVLNAHTQPLGLLIEKRAGAGGTEHIHTKVRQHGLPGVGVAVENEQLAVLAANLDHRSCLWIVLAHGVRLGDQLVDVGHTCLSSDRPAARSGKADRLYRRQIDLCLQGEQGFYQRLPGAAPGMNVAAGEQPFLLVQHD